MNLSLFFGLKDYVEDLLNLLTKVREDFHKAERQCKYSCVIQDASQRKAPGVNIWKDISEEVELNNSVSDETKSSEQSNLKTIADEIHLIADSLSIYDYTILLSV